MPSKTVVVTVTLNDKALRQAEAEGYAAQKDKLSCPYKADQPLLKAAWEKGYARAEADDADIKGRWF